MRHSPQKNWFSALLALLFALLLFFNANAQRSTENVTGTNTIYDEMLYNVPVQLTYDEDKYFVSGYEETVNVQLSSANRVQLNIEANEDTRSFQVVADLTKVPEGTSEVPLIVKGLRSAVTANIEPQRITVTIEKKVSKTFDVEVKVPASFEAEGYKVEKATVNPSKVTITTGEGTMEAIDRVIAPLSDEQQSLQTVKQKVNVQALDAQGQVLSIANPIPQVEVTLQLSLPSKEVPLDITPTGSIAVDVLRYTFALSQTRVEISGAKSAIEGIHKVEVPLDVSNIRSSTKRTLTIPVTGRYTVNPKTVEVTIQPVFRTTSSSHSQSTSTIENTIPSMIFSSEPPASTVESSSITEPSTTSEETMESSESSIEETDATEN